MSESSKSARDNRANQLNPDHLAYYLSRGASPEEAQQRAENHRATREHVSVEATEVASHDVSVKPR